MPPQLVGFIEEIAFMVNSIHEFTCRSSCSFIPQIRSAYFLLGIRPEYAARDKTDLIPSYWNRVTLKRCTNTQLVCEINVTKGK